MNFLPFKTDRKKQLLGVLIIASSLIPLYVIYMTFFSAPISVSIFTSIYSIFMVIIWVLYYFDFFDKKGILNNSNGKKLSMENNDESMSG
jgi:hypothetical protein